MCIRDSRFCGDDGHLFPHHSVQKRRFPHIGAAHDGHEDRFCLFLLQLFALDVYKRQAVTVERFKERGDKDIIDIDVNIYCEKKSHKGMILSLIHI